MDRKSIILLVVTFLVLLAWNPLVVNKLYPPKKLPPGALTNSPAAPTNNFGQPQTNLPPSPFPPPELGKAPGPTFYTNSNTPPTLLTVTNLDARYVFTSYGGGLDLIELLRYPETITGGKEKGAPTNNFATLNSFAPAPTLGFLGGEDTPGTGNFELKRTPTGVQAEKHLTNGLSIVKVFTFTSNYMIQADVILENHSEHDLAMPSEQWVVGTAAPLSPRDNGTAVGVMWYNGAGKPQDIGQSFFSTRGFACTPRIPPARFEGGTSNVVWVAAHNQFFALAAMPAQPAQEVVVYPLSVPRTQEEEEQLAGANVPYQQAYEAALVYPPLTLAPHSSQSRRVYLYAGPKEYQTLVRIADHLGNNIDLVMGYSGFFGFFAKAMLLAMNSLHHAVGLPYGWAIIAITVIIKLVYWPLTQASTRSMKRMQALQPQLNAIKEKYKDDQVKMQKRMMEFMKENKVSPLGGCLPSVLQIPVFFGFYYMIRSAIELRGASWLWVRDLSKPDTLFVIPGMGWVPFFGAPVLGGLPINLLPIIMGFTMLYQARLTPPSAGMDPAQAKMMRYMPLIFMVFLYNYSAGLTLYWTVQNFLTIIQTLLTRTGPPAAATPAPALTPPVKKRK